MKMFEDLDDPNPPRATGARLEDVRKRGRRKLRARRTSYFAVAGAASLAVLGVVATQPWHHDVRTTIAANPLDADVAWADLPPGTFVELTPSPLPSPNLDAPPCTASQLQITQGPPDYNSAGTGAFGQGYIVKRISGEPCLLTGPIDGLHADTGGQAGVEVRVAPEGQLKFVVPGVLRSSTDEGYLYLRVYTRCDSGASEPRHPDLTNLVFTLASGTIAAMGDSDLGLGCFSEGVVGAQLGFRPVYPIQPDDPWSHVVASAIVHDGPDKAGLFTYAVRLTNSGKETLQFDRCPNFVQLGDGGAIRQENQLNCAAAAAIPIGQSETFEMQAQVPSGSERLRWALTIPGAPQASVELTIPDPNAAAGPCDGTNSSLELGHAGAAAGTYVAQYVITNTSSQPCKLEGYPKLVFLTTARSKIVQEDGSYWGRVVLPTSFVLAPGEMGQIGLRDVNDTGATHCGAGVRFRFASTAQSSPWPLVISVGSCGSGYTPFVRGTSLV